MTNKPKTKKIEKNQNKDPFDEIVEILQDYDEGYKRDSKTDYEY